MNYDLLFRKVQITGTVQFVLLLHARLPPYDPSLIMVPFGSNALDTRTHCGPIFTVA